jgi:hypothetical protein
MTEKEVPAHHRPAQQATGHHATTPPRHHRTAVYQVPEPVARSPISIVSPATAAGTLRRFGPVARRIPAPGTAGYEYAALHLLDAGLIAYPNRAALREMWQSNAESR